MEINHILVPVDFSKCSLEAYQAALDLAKKINAKISVLHCTTLPKGWEKWPVHKKDENPFFREKEKEVLSELQAICDQGIQQGLEVKFHLSTLSVAAAVEEKLSSHSVNLVVMGSHGATSKQEYFIGSNAQKVLRKLSVPLIVLKSGIKTPIQFKKGLFASSLIEADQEALVEFANFGRHFGMEEIHILAVDTANYFSLPQFIMIEALKDFKSRVSDMIVHTHFQKDTSVEAGVRHYSEDKLIDLIGISNREKHPVKRIFIGSNVEMLINHCKVPVMSIDW